MNPAKLQTMSGDELARAKRRYAEILRDDTDDAQQIEEIRKLAFALDKTAADVVRDQATIARVKQLRNAMRNGRYQEGPLSAAAQAVDEHNAATRKILDERQAELNKLTAERDRLSKLQSDAREAVAEINRLRSDGGTAELLADEPEATLAELD